MNVRSSFLHSLVNTATCPSQSDTSTIQWSTILIGFVAQGYAARQCEELGGCDRGEGNPLLQAWKVNVNARTLPDSLKRMMKVAYKYNVRAVPAPMTPNVRLCMPYWYHVGTKERKVSIYGDRWGKCHRDNHNIRTVGEMLYHARKLEYRQTRGPEGTNGCLDSVDCGCIECESDRNVGCDDPPKCRRNAHKKLDNLEGIWDPRIPLPAFAPPHDEQDTPHDSVRLRPPLEPAQTPLDLVRIFMDESDGARASLLPHPHNHRDSEDDITVFTDGSCHNNGAANAQCGSGLWYGDGDLRNRSIRLPPTLPQSNNAGELAAILIAMQTHKRERTLRIMSDSQYSIAAAATRANEWLSRGFVGVENRELVMAIVGEALHSQAVTYFTKVKGHSGLEGNDGADRLANDGALKPNADDIDLSAADIIRRAGASLRHMTQALAYRSIRERDTVGERSRTRSMMTSIKATIEEVTGTSHTDKAVWRAMRLRKKHALSQKFSAWAWKTTHQAYKIGPYWRDFCVERAPCTQCDVPEETMEHILTECRCSGQEVIWELAQKAWTKTGLVWPPITLGLILGVGLLEVREGDRVLRGRTRLLKILISESAHLAWLLRCEWRLGREQDPTKLHTPAEVERRWRKAIERRMRMDWLLTSARVYGRRALRRTEVQWTWENLTPEAAVPDPERPVSHWVLVGDISRRRPPGRNR